MALAGRHDGQTQLVWGPLVSTCQIDGGRPQLPLLYIVDCVIVFPIRQVVVGFSPSSPPALNIE